MRKAENIDLYEDEEKRSVISIILKVLLGIIAAVLLILLCYVAYVFIAYYRIDDNQVLEVISSDKEAAYDSVSTGVEYTIGTYNVGFGAYLPDYSFFMDGGEYSRCYSAESGVEAITGAAELAMSYNPDFMLFEEVDIDSTRSWHVNQNDIIADNIFSEYDETFAVNYDSPYLFYPFDEPIGKSYSGMAFFSKYTITSSVRRSLPISTGVSKILDLDRCYSVNRIDADNGKELVIYEVHLSAYGNDENVRDEQTNMLIEDMTGEAAAGNYVICGGDFNHNLLANESSAEECESWAYPFPKSKLPDTLSFAVDLIDAEKVANMTESCRNADIPYEEGVTYVVTLDGFIVSDNVTVTDYEVVDTGFLYSDHEPVIMKFTLN